MAFVVGLLACLFAFVIRQSQPASGEEEWSSY